MIHECLAIPDTVKFDLLDIPFVRQMSSLLTSNQTLLDVTDINISAVNCIQTYTIRRDRNCWEQFAKLTFYTGYFCHSCELKRHATNRTTKM